MLIRIFPPPPQARSSIPPPVITLAESPVPTPRDVYVPTNIIMVCKIAPLWSSPTYEKIGFFTSMENEERGPKNDSDAVLGTRSGPTYFSIFLVKYRSLGRERYVRVLVSCDNRHWHCVLLFHTIQMTPTLTTPTHTRPTWSRDNIPHVFQARHSLRLRVFHQWYM
jgi:hypothetical protein